MKRKCAFLLLILGLLSPGMAAALGLGELTLNSFLNEPLRAEVSLLETGELDPTQIRMRLATRDDFDRAGVERSFFLTSLDFEVVGRDSGRMVLLIKSKESVREPYLNFIVEARWPTGRLLREYTVLLDPPVFAGEGSGITARATAPRRSPQEASQRQAQPASEPAEEPEAVSRMQQRSGYGSGALDRPVGGSEYFVQRNDTLWQIAESARPAGVSVQQTMLDILRMNPEAFIANNINQLKAGYVLRLPTADEISPISIDAAVKEVERQTQRWQDAAAGLDVRMDASEGLDLSGVSGSGSGEGHLQIAGVEDSNEPSSGDVSARMEDLDRTRRENRELSTRLDDMERQMETQERLISLKDEQIAALQQALEKAGESADMPEELQEGAISDLEPSEQIPAEPQPAEPAPTPAPKPEPKPKPAPPPEPEPTLLDMVMANIIYIAAGAAVLLLLLVLLLRKRLSGSGRRKSQDYQTAADSAGDDDDFADVSLSDDSLIVDEVDDDTEAAVEAPEPVSSFSKPDEQAYAAQFESGDALAEADIYIAYGRFPQAVDLLKAAIAHEPANTDYRIKLMEACIEMVESAEFQQQYADLQVIGDENVLQRARSLLEAVDGGEVWLDDLPPASITSEDVAAARAAASAAPTAEPALDLDLDIGSDDSDDLEQPAAALDEGLDLDDSVLDDTDTEEDDLDIAAGALDIDLDEAESEVTDVEFDLDDTSAESDLGLDIDEPEPEPEEEPEEITFESFADDDSGDELEDIELPDLELDSVAEEPADDSDDEDFDFSGDDDDDLLAGLDELEMDLTGDSDSTPAPAPAPAPEPEPEPTAVDDSMLDLDSELDGVDFDLGDDGDAGNLEDIELDMSADEGDEEGLMFAADGDEVATKLDLARAYIDMGDHDGARTILDEVVSSGNETQQQEARSLLEGID